VVKARRLPKVLHSGRLWPCLKALDKAGKA